MVLQYLPECRVVSYAFVQVEIQVDYFLDDLFHFVVKGNPHVLQCVDLRGGLQSRVLFQALHHPAQGDAVFGTQLDAETLVEISNDA